MPPPPGWIKLNFDGAFRRSTGKASIGGLARGPYGNLLLAYTCDVGAAHPLEAELLALQRGLLHLSHLHASPLLIEGDCLVLLTNIRNSGHLTWDMLPLWRRTMHMLLSFQQWTVQYCKRSANVVADLPVSYNIPPVAVTLTELPPHINVIFQMERDRARAFTISSYHHQVGAEIPTLQDISVRVTTHQASNAPEDRAPMVAEREHLAVINI
ncbi:hypothetical protein AAC387_Pa03g1324 [Persea americana]